MLLYLGYNSCFSLRRDRAVGFKAIQSLQLPAGKLPKVGIVTSPYPHLYANDVVYICGPVIAGTEYGA